MFQLLFKISTIAAPSVLAEHDDDTILRRRMSNLLRQRRSDACTRRIRQEGEHHYRFPNGSSILLRYVAPAKGQSECNLAS
jgi:hypothetical protein